MYPISQIVNIEGTGGAIIDYLGYIEIKLSIPYGNKMFKMNALLLVLPTGEYHKRCPISIHTSITNLVINSLDVSDFYIPHNLGKQFAILHKLKVSADRATPGKDCDDY